jgi:hypothetical protein
MGLQPPPVSLKKNRASQPIKHSHFRAGCLPQARFKGIQRITGIQFGPIDKARVILRIHIASS